MLKQGVACTHVDERCFRAEQLRDKASAHPLVGRDAHELEAELRSARPHPLPEKRHQDLGPASSQCKELMQLKKRWECRRLGMAWKQDRSRNYKN